MANDWGGISVISNPHAGDVFADEALAFELANGTVRITFAAARMTEGAPPSETALVVLGRLVMGTESAQRFAVGLFNFLKERGVAIDETPPSGPARPN